MASTVSVNLSVRLSALRKSLDFSETKQDQNSASEDVPEKFKLKGCLHFSRERSWLMLVRMKIVNTVKRLCGLWGLAVAKHPFLAVVGSILLVAFFGCGLARINLIFRPYDLWVPEDSEFYEVTKWMLANFPRKYRKQVAIWEADNILTASLIQQMWTLHLLARNISVTAGNSSYTFEDVCAQIPSDYTAEIKQLSTALGNSHHVCYETSLLELWNYDRLIINNLTDAEVKDAVNFVNVSKHFGSHLNASEYLGGIIRDKTGNIVRATSTLQTWITKINIKAVERGDYKTDVGTGEKIDMAGMEWEEALVNIINEWNAKEYHINLQAGHTLGHVLYRSITDDAIWIGVGWAVLLVYVIFTLGRPLRNDQRILPAIIGLFAIGMSVLASYGACSMFSVPYGTLTNVLPVLLVALGVDDMYVIVTAWDGIDQAKVGSVISKAQITMERAGMAITVTSLTDILAFIVGTTTSLPGLRYFCIYSAMGILMVYFLQATLFVAAMVVNQQWILDKGAPSKESSFTQIEQKFRTYFDVGTYMKAWGKLLMQPFIKVIVIVATLLMLLFSSFNVSNISREFDTFWLIPESSNLYEWYNTVDNDFPQESEKGMIFFKGVQLPEEIPQLKNLTRRLNSLPDVIKVEAWFDEFDIDEVFEEYPWIKFMPPLEQCKLLLKHIGIIYRSHFHEDFEEDLEDDEMDEFPCSTFKIEYQYIPPPNFESKQNAMSSIRQIVYDSKVSGFKAAWTHRFSQWETDRIILGELFQNLAIVLSAVGLITLILLSSLRASFLVLLCVTGTLLNVASFVHLWGLSVNTITIIAFVLAVGICVDYATHIAHDFLQTRGTKNERAMASLMHMGSAVLHGGCSTFITFVLLSPSASYIYISYFKILSCVSLFGLYHALVFLPVILSVLGPDSYPASECNESLPDTQTTGDDEEVSPVLKYNSSSVYTIDLPSFPYILPRFDPPPYIVSQATCPPVYRKSSSLPSLPLFFSDPHPKEPASCFSSRRSTPSSDKSFNHSDCCTKL